MWALSRTAGRAIMQIVMLAFLSRSLSAAEFGLFSAALVVVGFSQIFTEIGVGPALVQRRQLEEAHLQTAAVVSIFLGLGVGGGIYFFGGTIAHAYKLPDLEPYLHALAFLFPITGAAVVARSVLQRELEFKQLAGAEFTAYLIGSCALTAILILCGLGLWALIWGQVAEGVIRSLLLIFFARKFPKLKFNYERFKEIFSYSLGFTVAKLGNYTALQGDFVVAGRWLGASALGVYSRAYQFLNMPATLFGSVIDQVLFPAMATVQDDLVRLERAFLRSTGAVALLAMPTSAALVVAAPELVRILLGAGWDAVIIPFQVLASTTFFRASYKMGDSLSRATGAVYKRAWRQWVYAGAVVAGAFAGHYYGVIGLSIGVSAAIVLNYMMMLELSVSILRASWQAIFVLHLRHVCIALLFGAVAWFSRLIALSMELSAIGTLFVTLVGPSLIWVSAWMRLPKMFGPEGVWTHSLLAERLPFLR